MAEKTTKRKCENCSAWKNNQAELNYSELLGICLEVGKYTLTDSRCSLIDRESNEQNKKRNMNGFESYESLENHKGIPSRYCFVTNGDFSCNRHKFK